eukprot:COSAG01_NODE_52692_length_345_cov_0.341463_1_plen_76_part_10
MDALLPPEVIVASSPSRLIIRPLQARCQHAARFVIGHPFDAPLRFRWVEVVGGERWGGARGGGGGAGGGGGGVRAL